MRNNNDILEQIESLQDFLVSMATGGDRNQKFYANVRSELINNDDIRDRLPRFVRTCRDVGQLWSHFQRKSPTYQGRREYIWNEFAPLFDFLEPSSNAPGDARVSEAIELLDSASVREVWREALERRVSDPDGAITSARGLLESVCKHILDYNHIDYDAQADLPKLYHLTAESLELAPSQHTETVMKQILGSCASVVGGIAAMRNRLGDAHGRGATDVTPEPRHAELAVNLSGAMAVMLTETWKLQTEVYP